MQFIWKTKTRTKRKTEKNHLQTICNFLFYFFISSSLSSKVWFYGSLLQLLKWRERTHAFSNSSFAVRFTFILCSFFYRHRTFGFRWSFISAFAAKRVLSLSLCYVHIMFNLLLLNFFLSISHFVFLRLPQFRILDRFWLRSMLNLSTVALLLLVHFDLPLFLCMLLGGLLGATS